MSLESFDRLLHISRQYQSLLQAELSLQHQVRAALRAVHAEARRIVAEGKEAVAVGKGVRAAYPARVAAKAAAFVLGQDGGLGDDDIQYDAVPAWLTKPPKGIAKAVWHPQILLLHSPAAQVLLAHAHGMRVHRGDWRKQLEHCVKQLPIWQDWCKPIKGVDAYGLGRVLSATGDLWAYPTVAKVWKRMGVGLWQGERQRRHAGITEEEARAIAYSPRRRAMVWVLEDGLIKQNKACQGHNSQECKVHPGVYRQLYLDRKVYEAAKAPDLPPMVWHRRASRYMGKRFLRDLWRGWRATMPKPLERI